MRKTAAAPQVGTGPRRVQQLTISRTTNNPGAAPTQPKCPECVRPGPTNQGLGDVASDGTNWVTPSSTGSGRTVTRIAEIRSSRSYHAAQGFGVFAHETLP